MRYLSLLLVIFFMACKPEYSAQQIVDNSIAYAKLNQITNSDISFDFRKNHYTAKRSNGTFELTRLINKDSIKYKDVLSNNEFKRFVNDTVIQLSEKKQNAYSNSVNSVHYFSVLPLGLNDKAVKKELLQEVTIKDKTYFKIKVTFNEVGGGDDFDDVFIYWFAKDNFQLDYLAYKYHTNGGGIRFRDVKKENIVNGVRFVDYNNYKSLNKEIDFFTIDKLYEEGKLKKVSEIVLENIKVQL